MTKIAFPEGMRPLLVSTPVPFTGAQRVECALDPKHVVYEDPENVKLVRERDGWIVCVFCAVKLSEHVPVPIVGQLWKGAVREPQIVEPWKTLLACIKGNK